MFFRSTWYSCICIQLSFVVVIKDLRLVRLLGLDFSSVLFIPVTYASSSSFLNCVFLCLWKFFLDFLPHYFFLIYPSTDIPRHKRFHKNSFKIALCTWSALLATFSHYSVSILENIIWKRILIYTRKILETQFSWEFINDIKLEWCQSQTHHNIFILPKFVQSQLFEIYFNPLFF